MQSWAARAHQWCSSAIHCSAGQSVVITCMVQRVARSFTREQSDQGGRRSLQNDRSLGLGIVESEVVDGTYRLMSEAIRQCRGHVIRQSARAHGWPVPPDERGNQTMPRSCNQAISSSTWMARAACSRTHALRRLQAVHAPARASGLISGNQWQSVAISGTCSRIWPDLALRSLTSGWMPSALVTMCWLDRSMESERLHSAYLMRELIRAHQTSSKLRCDP